HRDCGSRRIPRARPRTPSPRVRRGAQPRIDPRARKEWIRADRRRIRLARRRPRVPVSLGVGFTGAGGAPRWAAVPFEEDHMKRDVILMVNSLVSAVLLSLHISQDLVFGFDKAGLNHLVGVGIILLVVCGTLLLPHRRLGLIIMLL